METQTEIDFFEKQIKDLDDFIETIHPKQKVKEDHSVLFFTLGIWSLLSTVGQSRKLSKRRRIYDGGSIVFVLHFSLILSFITEYLNSEELKVILNVLPYVIQMAQIAKVMKQVAN